MVDRYDRCELRHAAWWRVLLLVLSMNPLRGAAHEVVEDHDPTQFLDAMPAGYSLHYYDDCGVPERQPHVLMPGSYAFTFATSDTDADLKSRSAVFSYQALSLHYDGLDPLRSYVLVVTYASDHVYQRIQSLWAGNVQLHGPLALPKAQAIRRIVRVPQEVTRTGKLPLVTCVLAWWTTPCWCMC